MIETQAAAPEARKVRFNFKAPPDVALRFKVRAWLEGFDMTELVVDNWMASYGSEVTDADLKAYGVHEAREAAKLARRRARREGAEPDEAEAG